MKAVEEMLRQKGRIKVGEVKALKAAVCNWEGAFRLGVRPYWRSAVAQGRVSAP